MILRIFSGTYLPPICMLCWSACSQLLLVIGLFVFLILSFQSSLYIRDTSFTFRSSVCLKFIFVCSTRYNQNSFHLYGYLIILAPFVEKIIHSLLNCLCTLRKKPMDHICVRVYYWTLFLSVDLFASLNTNATLIHVVTFNGQFSPSSHLTSW